jgi:hypothetical protein
LEEAFLNKWLNPSELDVNGQPKFPTEREFHKAYSEAYGKAMAFKELYALIENADELARNAAEQITKPKKNYEL